MISGDLTPDEARQRLSEIMDRELPFTDKAEEALELGKVFLGVENGHLTKIDPQTDYWEAISSTDAEGPLAAGQIYNLRNTYCRRTLQQDTSIALHNVPAQGWGDDPAYETHGLDCYHGTEITIDNDTYGTVCFVSDAAREPFTAAETMFAELIARSLEHDLQRRQQKNELTRQSNLATVLNRVLRHNLRNSLTVIRGRAERIAEQFPASAETQSLVNQTDRLLNLSEKARVLESVIAEEFDREETSLLSLLDRVIHDVSPEFPEASITLEEADDVTVAVRPGLERALYELIENAAKHTGAAPTVTVSVEAVPNAVRIHIDDNGPGLAKIEQQVLTKGTETPLEHGTGLGLWLAYWIVTSHDGTIEATVNDGTCMSIELPRNAATAAQDAHERDEPTLARVQDKFRAVFDEASDAILIVDDHGRPIEVNERAADLFELPKPALLGRSIGEFGPDALSFEESWAEFQAPDRDSGTLSITSANGSERIIEYSAKPNVVPGQHLLILRDVTEREQRREALLEERRFIDQALDTLTDVFYVVDPDGGLRRWNQRFEEVTGYDEDTLADIAAVELFADADRERIATAIEQTLAGGDVSVEADFLTADGRRVPYEFTGARLTDTQGTVTGLVGVGRNITERNEHERELELAETVFQNSQDAFFLIDVVEDDEFRVQRVNSRYEELTGLAGTEIQGKTPQEIVGEEVGATIESQYHRCVDRRETIQYPEEIPVDGDQRYWETKLTPVIDDGEVVKLVGAMRDVTARRERIEELSRLDTALETVLANVPGVFWTTDDEGVFTRSQGGALATLGLEAGEVVGDSLFDVFDDHPDIKAQARRALDGAAVTATNTVGDTVFEIWFQPVRDDDGTLVGTAGLAYDVTDRDHRSEAHTE